MKAFIRHPFTIASLALLSLAPGATQVPETKIVIQAAAAPSYPQDAPCFVVYPEGKAFAILKNSGTIESLEKALGDFGYTLVERENEAAVFIRVFFDQYEPYPAEVEIKKRPRIDYSNAASTKNYAAMMKGGRYQQLANPTSARNRNDVSAILGPSGEVIMLSDQEPNAPKVIERESESIEAMVHPIVLEVSAWTFSGDPANPTPNQVWAALATYNNLRDEDPHPQLLDMSQALAPFFGKSVEEKLVQRN